MGNMPEAPVFRRGQLQGMIAIVRAVKQEASGQVKVRVTQPGLRGEHADYMVGDGDWIRVIGGQEAVALHPIRAGARVFVVYTGNHASHGYAIRVEDVDTTDPDWGTVQARGLTRSLSAVGSGF